MVLALFGSDLKACILEAAKTLHVQHEFYDCRCDIVKITFSQGGAKKSDLSSFQVWLPDYCHLSTILGQFGKIFGRSSHVWTEQSEVRTRR